jgi:hypothetical protein
MTYQIALVSESASVSYAELSQVCAAIQFQVQYHFYPVWKAAAIITPYPSLESVPSSAYWHIIVQDDINEPGVAGIHGAANNQPYALIQYGPYWSVEASHECLEMIADPWGNAMRQGPSHAPGQGEVSYVLEICDPVQDLSYAYEIYTSYVSNFYFPSYFDLNAPAGTQFDYRRALTAPLQVLPNGYISWYDPASANYFQLRGPAGEGSIVDLGTNSGFTPYAGGAGNLREFVDQRTRRTPPSEEVQLELRRHSLERSRRVAEQSQRSADRLRQHMAELKRRAASRQETSSDTSEEVQKTSEGS